MNQDHAASNELEVPLPEVFAWREIAIGSITVMDLSWGVIWVAALAALSEGSTRLDVAILLGVAMAGAHLLARGMTVFHIRLTVQRFVFLLFFLMVILAGFRWLAAEPLEIETGGLLEGPAASFSDLNNLLPAEFVIALAILFFGWRGIRLAQEFIGPIKVFATFRTGFLMFLLYIFIITALTGTAPGASWFVFLAAGLLGMACSRVVMLALMRGGTKSPFNREWMLWLSMIIGGTLFLSAGIAVVASGVGSIVIGIFIRLLIAIAFLVLSPIVFLVTTALLWIVSALHLEDGGISDAFSLGLQRLTELVRGLADFAGDYSFIFQAIGDLWLRWGPLIKLLVCSSVIVLVGLVVVLQLRERAEKRRLSRPEDLEGENSDINLLGLLGRAIKDRLSAIAGLFALRSRAGEGENLAAARIRQIYSEMGELSASLGRPRMKAQTPREYLPVLKSLFVSFDLDVDLITEAYIRVRYGEFPENQAELTELEEAWNRVEAFGRQRMKGLGGKSAG